jgi:hypothetical protein
MKTMLRWASALYMLSVSTMASAGSLSPGFTVGYNEAWFENYGFWLASNPLFGPIPGGTGFYGNSAFSESVGRDCRSNSGLVSTMLLGMAQGNAKVVRIFLFPALQGINLQTQGLTGEFLDNLETLFKLARKCNLKLYITALNANDANVATPFNLNIPMEYTYYQNLFSNSLGATTAYETSVLGPILSKMSQYQDVIYGFDLIDEIEAAINAGYFSNFWIGARAWIQNMSAFVKSYNPCPAGVTPCPVGQWLPVTSTAGLGYAVLEVTFGLFSGLGLNFYDVHIYSDSGTYSGQTALCFKTRLDHLQIVLGEYGQKSATLQDANGDATQNNATYHFLNGARSSCFSSALAWKYEALNTTAPWLSYLYITGSPPKFLPPPCPTTPPLPVPGLACARPAYTTIQTFCGQNAC